MSPPHGAVCSFDMAKSTCAAEVHRIRSRWMPQPPVIDDRQPPAVDSAGAAGKSRKEVASPGFEPGTVCVLDRRDNRLHHETALIFGSALATAALSTTALPSTALPTTALPTTALATTALPTTALPSTTLQSRTCSHPIEFFRVSNKSDVRKREKPCTTLAKSLRNKESWKMGGYSEECTSVRDNAMAAAD
ncbi:hypothetical protein GQ42DRAFT_155229 [Ramicandelaber brevisporus]|nr:hypothetical protein GQ42DRAFT_155229 [Ramicandelaber brevisporus]